jgi:hypothetical protein
VPDQGARLEYEIGARIELSRPHAKLGVLTAQRKVVVGSPDAGVENTNAVKDLAAKTHAAKQITDSADTIWRPDSRGSSLAPMERGRFGAKLICRREYNQAGRGRRGKDLPHCRE